MRESDIKNKWRFLLKDMNFDNKYHDDVEYYLEYHYSEIINNEDKRKNFIDIISYTLYILSKIDISKVQFIYDKKSISKKSIVVSDNMNYSFINPDKNRIIIDELVKVINDNIIEHGGVVIYKLINGIYNDKTTPFESKYILESLFCNIKECRILKINKLKDVIKQ